MMLAAGSEGPDQTARMRGLIWAFAVRAWSEGFFFFSLGVVHIMIWNDAFPIPYLPLVIGQIYLSKQCRPSSTATVCHSTSSFLTQQLRVKWALFKF